MMMPLWIFLLLGLPHTSLASYPYSKSSYHPGMLSKFGFPYRLTLLLLLCRLLPPHRLRGQLELDRLAGHRVGLRPLLLGGGASGIVSEPLRFRHSHERTLRHFPPASGGRRGCYSLPLPPGRYLLRTFTVYDDFDGRARTPSFDVAISLAGGLLAGGGLRGSATEAPAAGGLDLCFYSIATDAPLLASLELFQAAPGAYQPGADILVNYGRFSAGLARWGAGFTNDTDRFGRSWQAESGYRDPAWSANVQLLSALKQVVNADQPPNYFPPKLYEAVATAGEEPFGYELQVDAKLDDVNVTGPGQRVFDVMVNGENVSRVDVFKAVGGFAAYDFSYVVKNLSTTLLNVRLSPVVGAPIICGIENYAIVPPDLTTLPAQVMAMKALKESLRVPGRMGWNGDPCSPTSWDAWEGVTCSLDKAGMGIVISQIDLGSQGLKGYISDQISLLTNLLSLNLSSNSLQGTLPSGLGQKSIVKLDLSNNKFTGSIPDSLTALSLQLVLLQNNALEGQVPEDLYSVGVHGGTIDLSGNKGLCGVPSLPNCPLLWGKDGLSTGGKIAIALSCIFVICLVIFGLHIYIRKRQNDYDFGLLHEITALAAKRNRYLRQKSLMALEMESQHAKGFIPSYNSK